MNQIIIYLILSILLLFIFFYEQIKIKSIHIVRHLIQKYPLWPFFKFYDKSNPSLNELLNLVKIEELPKLQQYNIIPNHLFQIYMFYKNPIPQYIFDSINKYANGYEYTLFNEKDAILFLTKYFNKSIVHRFHKLNKGAHKADLLRYCYLYVYGGIYLDIKTILIKHLDEVFINKTYFYTCIMDFNTVIYNGLIASKPRNPIFLSLIWYILKIPINIVNEPTKFIGYLAFCLDFYKKIQKDLNNNNKLTEGLHQGQNQTYYLFKEVAIFTLNETCNKFDRYGGCIDIYDKNNKIFIGRDPYFPW